MINGNVAFKKQTKKVNYADIILRDGTVLELEPSDFSLGKFTLTDETTTGKFGVGHAVGKTISISIANHTDKFSMYDFFKAIIYVYVSVTLKDGTILKERKGKYYVINPATTGEVIDLQGVDSMHNFDRPYTANTHYPATLQEILTDCCLECGVNIGFTQFENYNFTVLHRPEDCTYRQVVSWVCQIAGYNARINNADFLELVWYETILGIDMLIGGNLNTEEFEDTYEGGDYKTYDDAILLDGGNFTDPLPENVSRIKSLKVSTDDVIITGVKVQSENKEVLIGSEEYCISIIDNDLVLEKEEEVASILAPKLIGMQFRPLTCEIPNNPFFEPFDYCYVYDRKGNTYFTYINSVKYSINGFTTISCKAEDPIRSESSYTSESAKAVVKARKEAKKELTLYDKAVQNMNMLSANAMGLYREQETLTDGSVIYYQSNRPITKNEEGLCEFELDSVVYKMTGDGFFVSNDGGLSFTSGFDSEGNAIVNVLSAIGIQFDWAKGGTLSLGGFDNLNGVIKIYDRNGENTGVIDNNGVALYSKNGTQIILSPLTGLVQRDSEGNEFYGLVYDEIVGGFSQYSKRKYTNIYQGYDTDLLNTTHEEKSEEYWAIPPSEYMSGLKSTRNYKKFTHWYAHTTAGFTTAKKTIYSDYETVTYQLPEKFKGKQWVIRVEQTDFDFTGIENSGMYYDFSYNETLPTCLETGKMTGNWLPWYDLMDSSFGVGIMGSLTQDSSVINQLKSKAKTTSYLSLPQVMQGNVDIPYTKEGMEEKKKEIITDYTWSYNEENATVTIKAKCELNVTNRLNLNEFMRFRIYVVC